jgi:hypothetical protein
MLEMMFSVPAPVPARVIACLEARVRSAAGLQVEPRSKWLLHEVWGHWMQVRHMAGFACALAHRRLDNELQTIYNRCGQTEKDN